MAMSSRWDLVALKQGAGVTLAFAVPFSVLARILHDNDGNNSFVVPLVLAAIVGFVLGAGVAAWRQRSNTPLSHGIVTAAAAGAGATENGRGAICYDARRCLDWLGR